MKYLKISIPILFFIFLIVFGISQHSKINQSDKHTYQIMHETEDGVMVVGGSLQDKSKTDNFKSGLDEGSFRKYWDSLHLSAKYEKEGNYSKAIESRKNALPFAKTKGDVFQIIWGLARLYEKSGQYELAVRELNKVPEVNDRIDVQQEAEEWKKRLQLQQQQ
jgi:tetratricopeptide (TPR) repeat protein